MSLYNEDETDIGKTLGLSYVYPYLYKKLQDETLSYDEQIQIRQQIDEIEKMN